MERVRSRTTPGATGIKSHGNLPGGLTSQTVQMPAAFTQTTTDTVIPKFRERSAKGEIFNNPFSSVRKWVGAVGTFHAERSLSFVNGVPTWASREVYDWTGGCCWIGTTVDGWLKSKPFPIIDTSPLMAAACNQALANVNKTDFMAQVFAQEWGKTKVLHRELCQSLVKAFTRHPKARNPGFLQSGKNLSNLWLTVRMGLLPTVSDLEGAISLLNKAQSERYTARGKATDTKETRFTASLQDGPGTWQFEIVKRTDASVRAGILYESTRLGQLLGGLGVTRPLSTVWELTKLSFVVDWVIDVGTWLDAIQPNGSSRTLSAWRGTVITNTSTIVCTGLTKPNASWRNSVWDGQLTTVEEYKSRVPWDASPTIVPTFGKGLNALRSVDAVALMLQRIPGLRRAK